MLFHSKHVIHEEFYLRFRRARRLISTIFVDTYSLKNQSDFSERDGSFSSYRDINDAVTDISTAGMQYYPKICSCLYL